MRHELGLLKSTGMKRELLNIYSCLSETEFQEEILQLGSVSGWRILDIRKFSLSNSKLRYADVLMYNLASGLYVFVELESADHNEEHVVNQMLSLSNLIANEGELRTRLAEFLILQGEDAELVRLVREDHSRLMLLVNTWNMRWLPFCQLFRDYWCSAQLFNWRSNGQPQIFTLAFDYLHGSDALFGVKVDGGVGEWFVRQPNRLRCLLDGRLDMTVTWGQQSWVVSVLDFEYLLIQTGHKGQTKCGWLIHDGETWVFKPRAHYAIFT